MNCHTVAGTAATGTFGPDLTHLMSRDTMPPARRRTRRRICGVDSESRHFKPGALMPAMQLSDEQIDQLVAYLNTLH